MKPIVSPWTIYFASRADSLKILAGCILICCIIAICIAFIEGDIDYGSVLTHKSFMKKCAIVSVISAVTLVITPSTETIYTMAVVKEITPDNIQAIGKTGKDVIDYITDQIDKVIMIKRRIKIMNTMAILLSDTYKQIHNKIYPKGLDQLVSYWTPRRSMLKNQNKMVFFGLQAFI